MPRAWLFPFAIAFAPAAYAEPLSFADALARSAEGPTVSASAAALRAAELSVGPAGALPDPQLVLGLENVPLRGDDRYRLDRDEMTMRRIGIMQDMPSGAERRARQAIARAQAARASAGLDIARLQARLGAARAWIGLYYAERRVEVLSRLTEEARNLAEAARARLSAGAGSVDDAIAAEIEAARVADRRADAEAGVIGSRAELIRWTGGDAAQLLAVDVPIFNVEPEQFRRNLRNHPLLGGFQAEAAKAEADVGMARAERWPDWSWELAYARRDPSFGDMASVEVRVGLPLFQLSRQGPIVEARRADLISAGAEREAAAREHEAMLEASLAEFAALTANLERSRGTRLILARQRASAAIGAFAAGDMTLPELIEARGQALEEELDVLELEQLRAGLGAALSLQFSAPTP